MLDGPRDMTDRELVELARQGDVAAVGELFSRYWRAARAAAFGVTGDFASAEDAAAEAFTHALTGLPRFAIPTGSARGCGRSWCARRGFESRADSPRWMLRPNAIPISANHRTPRWSAASWPSSFSRRSVSCLNPCVKPSRSFISRATTPMPPHSFSRFHTARCAAAFTMAGPNYAASSSSCWAGASQ